MSSNITLRWMAFQDYADDICALRRKVYVAEQGFREDMVTAPYDLHGLHLGAFSGDRLMSVVSASVYEPQSATLVEYGLPPADGRVVQIGKRASLPEFRGTSLNEVLSAMILRATYETFLPDQIFIVLRGAHQKLNHHYESVFGFQHHATLEKHNGSRMLMIIQGEERLLAAYLKARNTVERATLDLGIVMPSLVGFLERNDRLGLLALEKLKRQNLYVAPLSLKDELPRLSAQTRVLYREQKARLAAVSFPPAPARLLDLGCGPGVYLSMLSRDSRLRSYQLVGIDEMPEMVTYARLNRPDIRWVRASAYDTGEPAESYDAVHVNFMFIHLLNPAAVLREINRVLKPGGLFYIVETDDSTFEGPPEVSELIRSHCDVHLGNRRVMRSLPRMAAEHGFELAQSFSTRVRNTGTANDPVISGDEMLLNRITMWGMYSFLGQREELAAHLKAAQEVYFNTACEISVCVQTHVYRKVQSTAAEGSGNEDRDHARHA